MLNDLKKKVVEIAKRADNEGLCKHKSGNFSIRDHETGYILITPSAVAREVLKEEDIAVVDIEGNIIELKSDVKPSSELKVHLVAYKQRDDVFGVCHTHSHYATAFAVQGLEIKPVVFEAVAYGVRTPIAKYGRPGTQELANSIIEPLKESDACLLEKHGVITVGKDLEDAYLKAQYVEDVAEIAYCSMVIGGGKLPEAIPQEEFDAVMHP
ncbi:class II aldolase/adducin family protein [Sporosalibacterium faouarense]|uniref:class II aldolase/adducin family protein n=1 Tax=Sporosalibacterium faouarense TaxID=516123 RepID=UPI00141C8571|nr:class II aldolase/adducin family protein [Sporosalibacterium faouarense]MTI46601.1 class II aldolase/adducin family protein [Bacillota bacterium]